MYTQLPARLSEDHLQEWEVAGVSRAIIDRNVWTITDPCDVDHLLNRNQSKRWKHSTELVPGWAVAGVNPKTGERTFKAAQFKPDTAPIDPETKKPRKYFSPSSAPLSPLFLEMEDSDYWSKLLFDFTTPIILTEGAKKAGAVLSQGIPCISIPGVSTGGKLGRLRPELELFCRYGRRVYLAFDRDIVSKKPVQQALHNLARMIAEKGAMVYVLEWTNAQKGIDDYLASGGEVMPLIYQAKTIEEWRDDNESQPEALLEIETCRLALRYKMVHDKLKGRLRWNDMKSEVELDGQVADLDELRLMLALKHNIDIPVEDCGQIITYMARQQKFHPVAEYLHQCASTYQADSELLSSLAKTYLGTDSELHATFIRKTLIAAVARALSPGCKVDSVCILSGAQGVGKSSFWRVLAGDWFDDSVGSVSDKDERLKLHQSWFVEWAELEAVFRRKDISAVKAFITTQTDQIRPPYGRTVKEFPRPSIIVGTTNFDEFLADPTGNRRFWVVPIQTDWIPLDQLADERDRIWAAATHAFMQSEAWALPDEMKQAAAESGREFELSDPWEKPVLDFVEQSDRVSIFDILSHALHIDIERQDKSAQMRVANLLKANSWTTSREVVQGRRQRFWYSPFFNKYGREGCPKDSESQVAVVGQPLGQPLGQPRDNPPQIDFVHPAEQVVDNLPDQPDQIPKSSRANGKTLCKPSEPLDIPMERGDTVEVSLKGQWVKALYVGPHDCLRVSPLTRTLETAFRVEVGGKRELITIDCLRRLSNADG